MVASVILMGAGSLLVAVLPTYATIGAAAPALLLVARLMQGFSTGGQYGAAATYLSEIAEPGRRGFYASFQFVRSEAHTSELQSLMRISYAVFCLKKKKKNTKDSERNTGANKYDKEDEKSKNEE